MSTPTLAQFQRQFGDYLRRQSQLPQDASSQRISLYQSLVFNNVIGFVERCFPVCQTLVSRQTWQALLVAFLQEGDMQSPYFSQINEQFVEFLEGDISKRLDLPPFFAQLAHYEWMELYVDNLPDGVPAPFVLQPAIAVNPTVQALYYTWAVDEISANHLPACPQDTFLLIYRQLHGQTSFMQINALSFLLIQYLQNSPQPFDDVRAVLIGFASHVGLQEDLSAMAKDLFATMLEQQVFLTVAYD